MPVHFPTMRVMLRDSVNSKNAKMKCAPLLKENHKPKRTIWAKKVTFSLLK